MDDESYLVTGLWPLAALRKCMEYVRAPSVQSKRWKKLIQIIPSDLYIRISGIRACYQRLLLERRNKGGKDYPKQGGYGTGSPIILRWFTHIGNAFCTFYSLAYADCIYERPKFSKDTYSSSS